VRENRAYAYPLGWRVTDGHRDRLERDWGQPQAPADATRVEQKRQKTLIITVDDDNVYPREMVSTFVRFSSTLPDAALCFLTGAAPGVGRWPSGLRRARGRADPDGRDLGCGGILMSRALRRRGVQQNAAPRSAFFMDDIWISGHLRGRIRVTSFLRRRPSSVADADCL
jgi:hypothetical protein